MDTLFIKLQQSYIEAQRSDDKEKQSFYLEQMRNNLLERNGGNDTFSHSLNYKSFSIKNASYANILEINGDMNKIASQNRFDDININARENLLNKNKYGADNPYTGGCRKSPKE